MNAFKALLALLAVFILSQITGWPYLDELMLVIAGFVVIAFIWGRLAVSGIAVERDVARDRYQPGELLEESITVFNDHPLPKLWLEVSDGSTLPQFALGRIIHLGGRRSATWIAQTMITRRGVWRLGPTVIRSGDPFGFFTRRAAFPDAFQVIVYPPVAELSGFAPPAGQLSGGVASAIRSVTTSSNASGVREYVTGDPLNRISWAATARRGALMIKELDFEPSSDVWLILDLDSTTHIASACLKESPEWRPPPAPWLDSTAEYAISATASISAAMIDAGRSVGLLCTNASRYVIQPERGAHQQMRILETLAVVTADGSGSLAESIIEDGRRFAGPASIIVITASTDPSWVEMLVDIAGRRGRAAAVVIRPSSFGPAPSSNAVTDALGVAAIHTHVVACGDLLNNVLTGPGQLGKVTRDASTSGQFVAVEGNAHG